MTTEKPTATETRLRAMLDTRAKQIVEAMQRQVALQDEICVKDAEMAVIKSQNTEMAERIKSIDEAVPIEVPAEDAS